MAILFGTTSADSNGVASSSWTSGTALSAVSGVFRVRITDSTNYQTQFSLVCANGTNITIFTDPAPEALITLTEGGVDHYTGSWTISLNTWWGIGFTYDGTTLNFYRQGTASPNQTTHSAAATTLSGLQLGSQSGGQSAFAMQDVAIYSGVLSDAEMALALASRNPVPGRTLQAWHPMFGGGARLDDLSGKGRDLSVSLGSVSDATSNAPVLFRGLRSSILLPPQYNVSSTALAGTLSSGSTIAGSLTTTKPVSGSLTSASTLSAALIQAQPLAGTSSSASTLTASLVQAQALTGTSSSASTLAATMSLAVALSGTGTSASTFSASLSVAKPLSANALTSATTLSGDLTQAQALAGTQSSASTFAGTLHVAKAIAGAATSASTLAGALSQAQPLAGTASSASSLSGTLDVVVPLSAAASSASTLAGALTQAQALEGTAQSASSLSGALSQAQPLAGAATSASSFSGAITLDAVLHGGLLSGSTLTADLAVDKPLGADALGSTSSLAGALSVHQALAGALGSASTLTAALSLEHALSGGLGSASTLTGALFVGQLLEGVVSSASSFSGTLSGGTDPILPVFSGWADGGDVPDVDTEPGPWVPYGPEWTGELHGTWQADSEGEGDMAPHGRWYEDPVSGGVELFPDRWVNLAGTLSSASTISGAVALGPQPTLFGLIGGGPFTMQKDWQFGSSKAINNAAALNAEFTYHDPFNTIANGSNYGAIMVRAEGAEEFGVWNYEDIGLPDDAQPEDPGGRYRTFTTTTMQCHVKPLDTGSTIVGPASAHNAGCGSFVSQYTLPAGGARLGQDIVWETRARIVDAPNGYWFALWIVGPSWDGGPEIDKIEAFSSVSPNIDGDLFNANGIGDGPNTYDYFAGGFDDVLETLGIPGYALPGGAQSLKNWHTFTMVYRADDSFALYMDSTVIQSGTLDWKVPTSSTVPPLSFLFDFGFGHTQISPINAEVISNINTTPLTYEIDYSRVWLR